MSNLNKYEKLLYKHNRLKRHCGNQMNKIVEYKHELQRKDNNWNELKEFILNHYIVGHKVQNSSLDMIINKMKELETGRSDE